MINPAAAIVGFFALLAAFWVVWFGIYGICRFIKWLFWDRHVYQGWR
jgi:hypothetical protein